MAGLVPDSWGLGYLTDFTRPRSNTLLGLSAGLLSGDLSNAPLYAMEGKKVDDAYATAEKEKAASAAQLNQTIEFLRQTAPKYAEAVQAGVLSPGDAYKMYVNDQKPQAAATQPAAVQEYEYYVQQAREAGQQPLGWLEYQSARGGASERSLTPTYLRGPNGELVMGQANKGGSLDITKVPDGYTVVDPATLQGLKTGVTVDAKTAAAARAALPGAEQAITIAKNAISLVRDDEKGLSDYFGNTMGVPNRNTPVVPGLIGQDRGNWQANFSQAKGQAFMQARNMLKGGGPITDYEGMKGEAAFSRMEQAAAIGDKATFLAALDDFEAAVEDGYNKLVQTASGAYSAANMGVPQGAGDPVAAADALLNSGKY